METQNQEAKHWQSLDELAPEARETLKKVISEKISPFFVSRREFLEWMGGMAAVLGSSACTRQPTEKIVPYVNAPEYVVPGQALFFATASQFAGQTGGLLVESHMGRPTKIEGNPGHPGSLGGTDIFAQASVIEMYDPDRLQSPMYKGIISSWGSFQKHMADVRSEQAGKAGAGLRIVSESISSPTLAAQVKAVLDRYPKAKWVTYDSVSISNAREGAKSLYGEALDPVYAFDKADVIVSFDNDFLSPGYGGVRYTKDFSKRRGPQNRNRLYVVESSPTLAGASADHRWGFRTSGVLRRLYALASAVGVSGLSVPSAEADLHKWADVVARDLKRAGKRGVVLVGANLPASAHAIGYSINQALGSEAVSFVSPTTESTANTLAELAGEMAAGTVDALLILGGNPAYSAPGDVAFAENLSKVKFTASLSLIQDETAKGCQWMLPAAHYLEQWSDVRAYDGTVSIVQPLIAPLYSGKSKHELTNMLLGKDAETPYDTVRNYWKTQKSGDFESFWRKSVHDGVIAGSASALKRPSIKRAVSGTPPELGANGWDVLLRPDPTIWDGTYNNNPWLQELPKPLTKTTWENVVLLSKASADKLGVKNGDELEVSVGEKKVKGPAWVWPGHPDDSVTLNLGYGRRNTGRVGAGYGFDVRPLRKASDPWFAAGGSVRKTGRYTEVATTQTHGLMEGRDIVRSATLEAYKKDPNATKPHHKHEEVPSSIPAHGARPYGDNEEYAWGMAINLNSCTGCNACVVSCQSENNIATVGKGEVIKGRELHWLRIDRYYEGKPESPTAHFQPVPCMHCETAPCEVVCPVGATTHSPEGLNEMVYNRCVGTKYCSNNCPYKVRRFNFYHYSDIDTPVLKLQRNPDVTVRSRGVMEKCTYCVQRISSARIDAKKDSRKIKDGEIKTACQTACPADAIVFGNIKDVNSEVSKWKATPLNYGLLEEINTRPRTTYLAKLTNPNPELVSVGADAGHHEGGHGE